MDASAMFVLTSSVRTAPIEPIALGPNMHAAAFDPARPKATGTPTSATAKGR
jgi:hypothetical protein